MFIFWTFPESSSNFYDKYNYSWKRGLVRFESIRAEKILFYFQNNYMLFKKKSLIWHLYIDDVLNNSEIFAV